MNKSLFKVFSLMTMLAIILMGMFVPARPVFAASFTPGNLVIYRVGDGSAALNSNATAVFIDEYTPAGVLVQSIALPTTVSGANKRLVGSGTATSEGLLTRSTDGQYLILAGYDAALGTASITSSTSTAVNRVIGRVDSLGNVDTSTALTDAISGGNPRSAVSTNGTDLWIDGSAGGIRYTTIGSTTSTQLSTTVTNLRQTNIFNGQLYVSAQSGAFRLATVGTGTPMTSGQTIVNLPGYTTSTTSPYGFFFADLDSGIAGVDTVYVADDNTAGGTGGIQKYSLVSGNWTANGSIANTTGLRGLTGVVSGSSVTLYITNPSGLFTLTDTTGYNATLSGSLTSITTVGANKAFRGVALAPVPAGPTATPTDTQTPTSTPTPTETPVITDTPTNTPTDTATPTSTFTPTPSPTPVPAGSVVISQVYGGGGNSGAQFKNDFIELYNRSASTIILNGWSVQYASATGTSWQVTTLTGSIAPGEYYLVQEAAGTGGTLNLPAPDAVGGISMSATAGKVALVNNSTALSGSCPASLSISDLVGYGTTASCFEGSGRAPAPGNTTAVLRLGNGATDTDNNAADFVEGAPNPRSRTPSVVSVTPPNGVFGILPDTNITINFSKPMDVTGTWFTISCGSSGGHTAVVSGGPQNFTLDPDLDFEYNEFCTVTIFASQVSDQDANDPPDHLVEDYVFSFTTFELLACGSADTLIHQIQGSGTQSPLTIGTIVTIEGIVVGDYQDSGQFGGFHIQEEDADADSDPTTSEGIFVFNSSFPVNIGDKVSVKGSVFEFFSSGTPLTELTSVRGGGLCNSGNSVTPTTVTLPVSSESDWERYEGMLINISQNLTVTETFTLARFGEVRLSVNGRLFTPTNIVEPGPDAIIQQDLNDRSHIVLDDGNNQQNIDPTLYPTGGLSASNTLRSGYTVSSLTGVLEQRFGVYRVQPTGAISFNADNPRPEEPEDVGGNLTVVGMNLLNFFNTFADDNPATPGCFPDGTDGDCRGANSQAEFDRQYPKTVAAILAMDPDILGVNELENDGYGPTSAIQFLVDQLNAATAPGTYAFIDVDANTGQTNAMGTDAIKVALLYKPDIVTPVGQTAALNTVAFVNGGDSGPRSRPSLAQAFQQNSNGEVFIVDVNHLKSKGSECDDDPVNPPDGQGNCNQVRVNAATALMTWLAGDPTGTGDPDVLLVGDYNSYALEDPIDVIKAAGYTDLIQTLIGEDAYSFVFDGQSGYLDHALSSSTLIPQVSGVTEWHINADEPIALDYNLEFKSLNHQTTLYAPDQFRVSDHDPVIVGLNLDSAAPDTTIDSNPSDPSNSSSATFTFSGTDDVTLPVNLTFECDLDGGGFSSCTSPQNYTGLSDGSHTFQVRAIDGANNVDPTPASFTWTIDTTAPSVTIDQASGQADPTGFSPIHFTVVFSESVTEFDNSDVSLSGTAGATTAVVAGGPTTYDVAVSSMTANGTVIASIPSGAAIDAAGNNNTASTSTDNTVTYNNTAPTITVVAGGMCSSSGGTMNLTLSDVEGDALTLSGSSSNTAAVPNANIVLGGSGSNRTVTITAVPAATVRTAVVTLTVNDGISTSSVTVTVTVGTSANNPALNGTSGADLILGLDGNDTLNGLAGNDLLCGGAKNDTLNGGANDDTLRGEAGNDTLNGSTGADSFSGGPGNDTNTDFNAGQGDTTDGT